MWSRYSGCLIVAATLGFLGLGVSFGRAQGPSSRPVLSGPVIERAYRTRDGGYETRLESSDIPIPDLFRTEAPFVERNFRLDYLSTNNLQEPPADESQLFGEVSYSFTDRLGILVAAPYVIRDNVTDPDTSGFADMEAGVRYVLVGYENRDPFKLALGVNVLAPTGDANRELGEGQTFIEPEVLLFQRVADQTFFQAQFSLGIPTGGEDASTEFGWNLGLGYVYTDVAISQYFKFPTAVVELNGETLFGGVDADTTVLDVTPGLRWSIGSRAYGGVALSVPVTGPREFDTQFIFSLIYRYGPVDEEGIDATSSRAYF